MKRWLFLVAFALVAHGAAAKTITVGSKTFTESYVLGEIVSQLLEDRGLSVERKLGLGGTLITWEAVKEGSVDIYPDYTGTLTQAVLDRPGLSLAGLREVVAADGLQIPVLLGFNNSYAMAVSETVAEARGLTRVSDLAAHPDLVPGLSHEFLNRRDGWQALRQAYGLPQEPRGIEHALAYDALESGQLDITDAYSTDGELAARAIRLLEDDQQFFPGYLAVLVTRQDLPDDAARFLSLLDGAIDEATMRSLNYRVAIQGETPAAVASSFLRETGLVEAGAVAESTRAERILGNTLVHLKLTGIALLLACLVAIPLALLLSRYPRLAQGLTLKPALSRREVVIGGARHGAQGFHRGGLAGLGERRAEAAPEPASSS